MAYQPLPPIRAGRDRGRGQSYSRYGHASERAGEVDMNTFQIIQYNNGEVLK